MRVLRNIFRRRLRAFLTIFGITIGVFALVVMGGMAEKINMLVDGGTKYYSDKVIVSEADEISAYSSVPISLDKVAAIEKVDGVLAATPTLMMPLDTEGSGMSFGLPPMIYGGDPEAAEYESFKVSYKEGRALQAGETGRIEVGADLVNKLDAKVGGRISIRGESFEVVGILEKTLTAPDTTVSMALSDAQRLFHQDLPEVIRKQVSADMLATSIVAYVEPGRDADQVARAIEANVPAVKAVGPAAFQENVQSATRIFNAIIFGVALISLLVGGLSVVNTMTMSVYERTREIGIRKSIGASHAQVVREFLLESAVIGLLGGASGALLGWLFSLAANAIGNDAGTELFFVSPRLAAGALLFALFLGVVSGLYPSWHAARLSPVAALRYE